MEIARQTSGQTAALTLRGRLDAAWCGSVAEAVQQATRDGFTKVSLDMRAVSFVSSAGIRVLLGNWKELRRANGQLAIAAASPEVERILRLAGLGVLLEVAASAAAAPVATTTVAQPPSPHTWTGASFSGEVEEITPGARLRGRLLGASGGLAPPNLAGLCATPLECVKFPASAMALGLGAFGGCDAECIPRMGELLGVGGCAVCLPADGSNQPDYSLTEGAFAPEARMALGLAAEGAFAQFARFEATGEAGVVAFTELASGLLALADAPQIAVAAVVESAALVGACLRRSPNAPGADKIFEFPAMRDWLTFTAEPAYGNSVALLVGVLTKNGAGPLADFTRPLAEASGPRAHVHAAAFPFRPVRHGRLALVEAAAGLFEAGRVLGVLHLLADRRPEVGAGESRFYRGACWFGPLDI